MFKKFKKHFRQFERYFKTMDNFTELNKKLIIQSLQKCDRYQNNKSLVPYGYKLYSKNEEDGYIKEVFKRIGTTNKIFIEIGVDDGLENNTLALLFENWKGLWIEASVDNVNNINKGFPKTVSSGQIKVVHAFVTKENINALISQNIQEEEVDLLSIDIDGNDFHVFESITCIRPRVLVIEYNAKFHPPVMYCMRYDQHHIWKGTDHFGASLKSLEVKLKEKGYWLVGCNLTGGNAFFVREQLVEDKFHSPFTAENHYEPARYELAALKSGHRASYETLESRM